MAKWLPRKKVVTIPPITQEIIPVMGSTLEASAIPSARGSATNATLRAAIKSLFQFSTKPL
jgi:hypothetical protein